LRPVKSYVVGQVCPRRDAAGGFKNFPVLLQLQRNVNRNATLQEK
jgi:hypothetical protein